MKQRYQLAFLVIFGLLTNTGCATKEITFTTDGKATVSLVSADRLEDAGEDLGQTPLTVPLDKVKGKVIRLSQAGKQSLYWFVADAAGQKTEARFKLLADGSGKGADGKGSGDRVASTNRVMRLVMRAYQALSGRHYQVANELADQAAAISPEVAAPHVVKGIALMQQGDKGAAKAAFEKAKTLDPEDKNLDTLLKVLE